MAGSLVSLGSRMSSSSSRKASIEKDAVEVTSYEATLDADEALLRQLGYKQELRRTFTPLELFGVGMSMDDSQIGETQGSILDCRL